MKRLGVLSLVFDNYGTRLQSYALFKVLKTIVDDDYSIEFINIENTWNPRNEKNVFLKLIYRKLKSYGLYGLYKSYELCKWFVESKKIRKNLNIRKLNDERHSLFKHIISLIPYTKQFYTCQSIRDGKLPNYDTIIVGSDQVWNGKKIGNQDVYMLDYTKQAKCLTYAASFGMTHIPTSDYKKRINNFSSLLIREQSGVDLCKKLGRSDAKLVLDPTLLLESSDYDKDFSNSEINLSYDYVLVYSLNYSYKIYTEALAFCKKNHCKLVVLKRSICPPKFNNQEDLVKEYFAATPDAFINLIRNAKLVITNSYHAMLFSIIYRKDFYLYLDNSDEENSRLLTVIKLLKLNQNVFWESEHIPHCIRKTDYSDAEKILILERQKSIDLLKESIGNA